MIKKQQLFNYSFSRNSDIDIVTQYNTFLQKIIEAGYTIDIITVTSTYTDSNYINTATVIASKEIQEDNDKLMSAKLRDKSNFTNEPGDLY